MRVDDDMEQPGNLSGKMHERRRPAIAVRETPGVPWGDAKWHIKERYVGTAPRRIGLRQGVAKALGIKFNTAG